jgi:hypothetical protein
MSNATKAFFKSAHGVVLAVYDTRRGQIEGREAEKILAFYPPTAAAAMQSSIVGLAQALTMFAGTFNKVLLPQSYHCGWQRGMATAPLIERDSTMRSKTLLMAQHCFLSPCQSTSPCGSAPFAAYTSLCLHH